MRRARWREAGARWRGVLFLFLLLLTMRTLTKQEGSEHACCAALSSSFSSSDLAPLDLARHCTPRRNASMRRTAAAATLNCSGWPRERSGDGGRGGEGHGEGVYGARRGEGCRGRSAWCEAAWVGGGRWRVSRW